MDELQEQGRLLNTLHYFCALGRINTVKILKIGRDDSNLVVKRKCCT